MSSVETQQQVQEAILDFTMGDYDAALKKLEAVLEGTPDAFDALLAKTEVLYASERYDEALVTAERAEKTSPEDVHLKTSLSRIWMQLGDTNTAEKYAAEAKMLTWKAEIMEHESSTGEQN